MEKITNEEKVISFLAERKQYFCDDCISKLTGIYPRQQINQICNGKTDVFERSENIKCHNCGKIKITRTLKNLK